MVWVKVIFKVERPTQLRLRESIEDPQLSLTSSGALRRVTTPHSTELRERCLEQPRIDRPSEIFTSAVITKIPLSLF